MKEKSRAVFLSDIGAARIGIALLQIQKTNPETFDEAIIYHSNFSDKEKELLSKIMPCRFVVFDSPLMQKSVMKSIFS